MPPEGIWERPPTGYPRERLQPRSMIHRPADIIGCCLFGPVHDLLDSGSQLDSNLLELISFFSQYTE